MSEELRARAHDVLAQHMSSPGNPRVGEAVDAMLSFASSAAGQREGFRDWLTFTINCARSVPDALDPNAASILENVRDQFDAITSPSASEEHKDEVERLREVLKPFVAHWEPWMDKATNGQLYYSDDDEMSCFARVTYGDLRRARAMLAAFPSAPEERNDPDADARHIMADIPDTAHVSSHKED